MNNRGFTLIELLVTIMILALVAGIGTYSIINLVNATKEENYNVLIHNIKDAAEAYYQECKYGDTLPSSVCKSNGDTTIGNLLKYGFITGNGTNNNNEHIIVNPKNNANIGNCQINIVFTGGKIVVTNKSTSNSNCPQSYDD